MPDQIFNSEGIEKGDKLGLWLRNISECVAELWEKPHHLHYTDHGLRHSDTIINRLSTLLKGQTKVLSHAEWFLLKASVYLHDIGMQCTNRELLLQHAGFPERFELPFTPPLLEKIRDAHNILSYYMIMKAAKSREEFTLIHKAMEQLPPEMLEAVAVLSLCHKGSPVDKRLDSLGDTIPGGPVNLRILCTLLRFGDTLDADSSRINMERFIEMRDLLRAEKKIHIWKHHFVSSVTIREGLVELRYKIPELYKGLTDTIIQLAEGPLNSHRDELLDLWRKEGIYIKIHSLRPQAYLELCPYPMSGDTLDYLKNWGKGKGLKAQQAVSAKALSEKEARIQRYWANTKKAFEIDGYEIVPPEKRAILPLNGCSSSTAHEEEKTFFASFLVKKEETLRRIIVFPFILSREDVDIILRSLKHEETWPITIIMDGAKEEGVWGYGGRLGIGLATYASLIKGLLDFKGYVHGLISEYMESKDKINQMYVEQDAFFYTPGFNKGYGRGFKGRLYENQDAHFNGEDARESCKAEDLVAEWLRDPNLRHLTILGDFGTGKTVITKKIAYTYGQAYFQGPDENLIPVRIDLKNVKKNFSSVRELIEDHFREKGLSHFNYKAFELLMEEGLILLIYDSFDEMALETGDIQERFKEINRLASEKAKIILTSRTHYFLSQEQELVIHEKTAGPTSLGENVLKNPDYRIAYLDLFNEEKIRKYLHNANLNEEEVYQTIRNTHPLEDLATRPLFLEMIKDTLHVPSNEKDYQAGKINNVGSLYKQYIRTWLEKSSYYQKLSPEEKLTFSKKLAWEMWNSKKEKVHFSELYNYVFKMSPEQMHDVGRLQEAVDTVRDASFLIRDDKGNYRFSHRSFMEAFLAWEILDNINAGNTDVFSTQILSQEVIHFLYHLSREYEDKESENDEMIKSPDNPLHIESGDQGYHLEDKVISTCKEILNNPYRKRSTENALQTIYWMRRHKLPLLRMNLSQLTNIFKKEGISADFSNAQLSFPAADFSYFPFNACLAGNSLMGTDLSGAVLSAADFSGMILQGVKLDEAHCKGILFQNATLGKCTLEYAVLNYGNFSGAHFKDCRLWAASFLGANLNRTGFTGCDMGRALFYKAQGIDPLAVQVKNNKNITFGTSWGRYREALRITHLEGHTTWVNCVCFSPDGRLLASGSSDKTVILWDARTGNKIRSLDGHKSGVESVAFSPDGRLLASGSSDIILWDSQTGKRIRTLDIYPSTKCVSFSPDGRLLASGNVYNNTITLWDVVGTGERYKTLEGLTTVLDVAFISDRRLLVSGIDNNTIILWDALWDAGTGKRIGTLEGHKDCVRSVAFSPDRRLLASGGDTTIILWDVETGKRIKTLEGHRVAFAVAFSTDGRLLASGNIDNTIILWDAQTGKRIKTLEGHTSWVKSVAFSPDRGTLASGSQDATIILWDARTVKRIRTPEGHKSSVRSVAFSPDRRLLASGSGDDTIILWDAQTGKKIRALEGHKGCVQSVAFSPDGRLLASGSGDNTIIFWDARTGKKIRALEVPSNLTFNGVTSVAFSPEGRMLASVGTYTVILWDARTGKKIRDLGRHEYSTFNSVAFSPDGRLLAGGNDHYDTITLWDAQTGKRIRDLESHRFNVTSVAFSPDGGMLAASGIYNNTVILWDAQTGNKIRTLEGHKDWVPSVAFSPDGRILASGSYDSSVILWDVQTGELVATLLNHLDLTFTPEGYFFTPNENLPRIAFVENLGSYPAEELHRDDFYSIDPLSASRSAKEKKAKEM